MRRLAATSPGQEAPIFFERRIATRATFAVRRLVRENSANADFVEGVSDSIERAIDGTRRRMALDDWAAEHEIALHDLRRMQLDERRARENEGFGGRASLLVLRNVGRRRSERALRSKHRPR